MFPINCNNAGGKRKEEKKKNFVRDLLDEYQYCTVLLPLKGLNVLMLRIGGEKVKSKEFVTKVEVLVWKKIGERSFLGFTVFPGLSPLVSPDCLPSLAPQAPLGTVAVPPRVHRAPELQQTQGDCLTSSRLVWMVV